MTTHDPDFFSCQLLTVSAEVAQRAVMEISRCEACSDEAQIPFDGNGRFCVPWGWRRREIKPVSSPQIRSPQALLQLTSIKEEPIMKRISVFVVVAALAFASGYSLGGLNSHKEVQEHRAFVEFARTQLPRFTGAIEMRERLEELVRKSDARTASR